MTYFHAFLEIVGALAILGSILMILGATCLAGKREDLRKFNENSEHFRFSKIRSITRLDSGKPRSF